MILWLASYPRSGNTYLRVVLHRLYGVPTYTVYDDDDPVAQRVGPALVGYGPKPADRTALAESAEVFFMKTHKRRKADGQPAIYLVRDGRDAVVSHARLRASLESADDDPARFERLLREEITRPYVQRQPSSGSWGGNVLSWLDDGGAPTTLVRYEELIASPSATVQRAVAALLPEMAPLAEPHLPAFGELQRIDPAFFRRGTNGSFRDEMPEGLHQLFWARPDNAAAMQALGYGP